MRLQAYLAYPDHAEHIAQLVRLCWQGRVHPDSSGHRETAERVLADLKVGWGLLLKADQDWVGTVRWVRHPREAGVVEVRKLGVLPTFRRMGLGRFLMESLEEMCCQQAHQEIRLAVRHDQPRLVAWYAQLGFNHQPDIMYSAANPQSPPPFVLRKTLEVSA